MVYEFPQAEGDPYYPIPRAENSALYKRYQELADQTPGVYFVGRLASYRYYNMDQVVGAALTMFRKITGEKREGTNGNHTPNGTNGRVVSPAPADAVRA